MDSNTSLRRARIVCTIGPASRDPDKLRQLLRSGMDIARLNMSHADLDSHRENVERIRAVSEEEGLPVGVLVDLQGPRFRIGEVVPEGVQLEEGSEITLTTEDVVGKNAGPIPVQNDDFPELVSSGDQILIDDGLIELRTLETSAEEVRCKVVVGGRVKKNKGMNLPGIAADLPAITQKDRRDLAEAIGWGVDWIALSFVRSGKDLRELKQMIEENGGDSLPVIAKIEKPDALEHLDEIIEEADAVMVARGDLGIEIPPEKVPMAQKSIIRRCNEAGIPVITATQMLESMIRHPRPTRAEASDVANALLDGTDAVMLSGETSIGTYPIRSVQTMAKIIHEVEAGQDEITARPFRPLDESIHLSIARAVARSAREAAQNLGTAAIIAVTSSGYTARIVSRYRPSSPIIAVTPEVSVQRRLMLYWGVTPLVAVRTRNTDEMITNALDTAQQRGLLEQGDLVAVTAGTAGSEPGTTNLLRIQIVE